MLDCPKCIGKLEEIDIHGVKIDVCNSCEGIWFDKNELEEVLNSDILNNKTEGLGLDSIDGMGIPHSLACELNEKEGKCPRCNNGTMLVHKESAMEDNLFVDECPKCGGLWLDGGEIKYLRVNTFRMLTEKMDQFAAMVKMFFMPVNMRGGMRRRFF